MHIDTLSMTGKIEDLHYSRLHWQQNFLRILDIHHQVKGGGFRFMSELTHIQTEDFLRAYFKEVFHCDLVRNEAGKNGYERSYSIYHGVFHKAAGFVAFGGNRETYQFYINGEGCAILKDKFVHLYNTAQFFNMKLTRIDIAQDFFNGEFTVKNALSGYEKGSFQSSKRGRKPTAQYIDDMGSGTGKTLYVGKLASSGREVCVYEKGKQLKSSKYPKWVRWELRLGKRDRVLPLDLLINFQSYYQAELPILNYICKGLDLITHAVSSLRAKKERVQADMSHLINWASIMYGKLFNVMREAKGMTDEAIVQALVKDGVPTRLVI